MERTRTARGVDDVARDLIAPLLSGPLPAPGWTLAGWDAEQGICLLFASPEGHHLLLELEQRNDQLDCYARTERFNVCARRQGGDRSMSDADRRLVDAVITLVRGREGCLPSGDRPPPPKVAVREILVDRVLMPEGRGQYYINPYVGCMIACPFCYVADRADFSRRLEGLPQLPWGRYLDVKINAAEVLRREVATAGPGVVRMSPIVTDPYQPAERRYRLTRQILEVLVDSALAPVVLTRAPLIVDDLPLLQRFRRALVGFSIPTDADEYRRLFEPDAPRIEERFAALRALHGAGIGTFAVIQPVLPMNPERLIDALAPYVRAVRLDRLYFGDRIRAVYEQHGLGAYATDAYASATIDRLTDGFRARGVVVDPLDDFEPLLG